MKSYNGFSSAQRNWALAWLKREYAAGRRQPPLRCDGCGQEEGIIDAHSEDYSQPFGDHIGAFGFCYTCHMMIHCRFGHWEAWDRYRAALREGRLFVPFHNRAFRTFQLQFLGEELKAHAVERVGDCPLSLDEIARSRAELRAIGVFAPAPRRSAAQAPAP
jgi:hypothetical protein